MLRYAEIIIGLIVKRSIFYIYEKFTNPTYEKEHYLSPLFAV